MSVVPDCNIADGRIARQIELERLSGADLTFDIDETNIVRDLVVMFVTFHLNGDASLTGILAITTIFAIMPVFAMGTSLSPRTLLTITTAVAAFSPGS
jgi:hypothetical protein